MGINFKHLTDGELVLKLKSSKKEAEAAFTELYNRYSPMVHAYCMRVVDYSEHAEDIFQKTFIRFYNNVTNEVRELNVPGFLITIARNLCLNYKRDKKNNVSIDELDNVIADHQNYEKKELLDLITRGLELIDDDLREAFVLKEYNGMQYNEIAEICNITVVNAKSRVFRAKQKLKSILQPYLNDLQKN